jgi:hypothetical protein
MREGKSRGLLLTHAFAGQTGHAEQQYNQTLLVLWKYFQQNHFIPSIQISERWEKFCFALLCFVS